LKVGSIPLQHFLANGVSDEALRATLERADVLGTLSAM
jgi:hypothetical protein